jgi:hypothetical protein
MEKESLKQLHIIPRTPSPSPPPSRSSSPGAEADKEGNAAGLTQAEQRLLEALIAKQNKGRKESSAAAAGGSKRKATRIKKEHVESRGLGGRAAKRARKEAPMMIDLTGDDDEDVEVEDENELFVS